MKHFYYKENKLFCEDIVLEELITEFDSPLYVYSKNQIIDNCKSLVEATTSRSVTPCYAVKANYNPTILSLIASQGLGADVVSAGELSAALKAGFPANRITFAGVGKREDEIEYATQKEIAAFNVESVQELQLISRCALRLGKKARVCLRIIPNVDAETHPNITTGMNHNKFGIEGSRTLEYYKTGTELPNIEMLGIHVHIGSQITKADPFTKAATIAANVVGELRAAGMTVNHIDFGGGCGVRYVNALEHEAIPREENSDPELPVAQYLDAFLPILKETGCQIWIEPGRLLVADSCVLITRVLYTKETGNKKFIIVDAGMTELIRPALYDSYHQIVPLTIETYEREIVDIVGPVCESSDFFAKDRLFPKITPGQHVAILTTGAYGYVQSTNYNSRPRPAEIMVNGERVRTIREREPKDWV